MKNKPIKVRISIQLYHEKVMELDSLDSLDLIKVLYPKAFIEVID